MRGLYFEKNIICVSEICKYNLKKIIPFSKRQNLG